MSLILTIAVLLFVAAVAVPVAIMAVEIFLGCLPQGDASLAPGGPRPRVAVLIPAHNESAWLIPTVEDCKHQLGPGDRILVVADNCSDDTAAVARAQGCETVERTDPVRRGKGYALDFGRTYLAADPPAVTVVVDADCRLAPDCIAALAEAVRRTGRTAQALYFMRAPAGAAPVKRIAAFAWLIRNFIRPRGLRRMGGPCQLTGTGMAFPWPAFASLELATGNIVEDLNLGLDLAQTGQAPLLCLAAQVDSTFPLAEASSLTQRRRWERGALATAIGRAPRLFAQAVAGANSELAVLALDILVPPLVMLGLLVLLALAAAGSAMALGASPLPFRVASTAFCVFAGSLALAWLVHGRSVVSLRDFAGLAPYLGQKIGIYRPGAGGSGSIWTKTGRD